MELYRERLSLPRISVISAEPDRELDDIARTIRWHLRVEGRDDLERELGRLLAASTGREGGAPRTLDLIGHSVPGSSQLRLGGWTIDAASPTVRSFFRGLADQDVLPRLGIGAVRLLGCHTAAGGPARTTLVALAGILGIDVHGTNHLLYRAHYDEQGFRDLWRCLLVGARELSAEMPAPRAGPAEAWPRRLDIDSLPASALPRLAAQASVRVATVSAAQQILQLIRCDAGARMPGPAMAAIYELALPSGRSDTYHVVHVLLDGAFVRFFPDGVTAPGVVYPVDDAPLLCRIVDGLPMFDVTR